MTDDELIAEAIAAGIVRRIPMGGTSGWDDLSVTERHGILKSKNHGSFLFGRGKSANFKPMPIKLGTKR
jgi:hypothetical protein